MDSLTAIAEPTRRRIVDALRMRACTVSDLVEALEMSQPAVSKHLRVLREAGVVTARVQAQQRIYRLEPGPFRELDAWLAPYRRLWTHHLAALERHLDAATDSTDPSRESGGNVQGGTAGHATIKPGRADR
jgi:DNA-binding transcriptional ArsR family regulator